MPSFDAITSEVYDFQCLFYLNQEEYYEKIRKKRWEWLIYGQQMDNGADNAIFTIKMQGALSLQIYKQYQLMRKKIILQVDKLIQRQPRKETTDPPTRPHPEKKHSFDQMYRQAKKQQNRTCNTHASTQFQSQHSATNSFQNFYQSLRASRNTPNNTHRMQDENTREKLNRSLQAKSNSIERSSPVKRSTSSEKHRVSDKRGKQNHGLGKKNKRQDFTKSHKNALISQWEGLEQFQSQWKTVISHLDHAKHQHLRQTQCFLSLAEIFQILISMHYLRKVQDERLLVNLWRQLQGQTYGGVPSNNLRQFLTIVNYCPSNICYQNDKNQSNFHKRIILDSNLKIVISESAKIQIYEEYLPLRVNRILYGSAAKTNVQQAQSIDSDKNKACNNIKIEQEENTKKKIVLGPSKKSFQKPGRMSLLRQKRSEQITRISQQQDKQQYQDTICYSQFSQSKQSGKILTSNQSQNSISNTELIEQVVIKRPILSVDVNLGDGLCQKLTVFEGQTASQVSHRLVEKYNIDESLRAKFEAMLSGHIRNLLYRIDEVSQEMFSDREE